MLNSGDGWQGGAAPGLVAGRASALGRCLKGGARPRLRGAPHPLDQTIAPGTPGVLG